MREANVAVGFLHQLAHEILNVAADVTRLAEFRRVCLDERHLDQIGNVFDQVSFSDAGRSDQNHILLCVLSFFSARRVFLLQATKVIDVIVVIANRDREHLLGIVLLNDESVEMRFDLARQEIENKFFATRFLRFLIATRFGGFRLRVGGK